MPRSRGAQEPISIKHGADDMSTLSGLVTHPDIACSRCGQEPLIASRFCAADAHTDLCQACHRTLPVAEQPKYQEIKAPPPLAA